VEFKVIAGPCTIESRESIEQTAHLLSGYPNTVLKGGAFKPFTYAAKYRKIYQKCMGIDAYELLSTAATRNKLSCISEVMCVDDLPIVDGLITRVQVGSRNQQNFVLLEEIGLNKYPVFLKRHFGCSLDELYASCTYLENCSTWVCERGIVAPHNHHFRFLLDLHAVAVWRQRNEHIPIFVDCSHFIGTAAALMMTAEEVYYYVSTAAKGAKAVGANGIYLDVSHNPAKAWTDPFQCLSFEQFRRLMDELQ
jgi:3-deoxy-7-phosphoheptulonate synthase